MSSSGAAQVGARPFYAGMPYFFAGNTPARENPYFLPETTGQLIASSLIMFAERLSYVAPLCFLYIAPIDLKYWVFPRGNVAAPSANHWKICPLCAKSCAMRANTAPHAPPMHHAIQFGHNKVMQNRGGELRIAIKTGHFSSACKESANFLFLQMF